MKCKLLILTLLSISLNTFGQNLDTTRNYVKTGINYAFFGSGDVSGTALYAEYTHYINKYFGITPKVNFGNAYRKNTDFYEVEINQVTIKSVSLSANYKPMPLRFSNLSFGFGGLISVFDNTYIFKTFSAPENISVQSYSEIQFGLLGSLKLDVIEEERFNIGLNAELLTTFYGKYLEATSYQYGAYFAFKIQ